MCKLYLIQRSHMKPKDLELDVEKAAEKYGMNNVRNFIFKKHPDSGRVHILSQDTHLFLPYDLTAHRHPPFLSSSPRAR